MVLLNISFSIRLLQNSLQKMETITEKPSLDTVQRSVDHEKPRPLEYMFIIVPALLAQEISRKMVKKTVRATIP